MVVCGRRKRWYNIRDKRNAAALVQLLCSDDKRGALPSRGARCVGLRVRGVLARARRHVLGAQSSRCTAYVRRGSRGPGYALGLFNWRRHWVSFGWVECQDR